LLHDGKEALDHLGVGSVAVVERYRNVLDAERGQLLGIVEIRIAHHPGAEVDHRRHPHRRQALEGVAGRLSPGQQAIVDLTEVVDLKAGDIHAFVVTGGPRS
jgi:hypothetical protein